MSELWVTTVLSPNDSGMMSGSLFLLSSSADCSKMMSLVLGLLFMKKGFMLFMSMENLLCWAGCDTPGRLL